MLSKCSISYEEQDKLNRIVFADMIVRMVDWVEGPYVININGDWGTGKTFFMGLLAEKLDGKCVYINAYENDYYNDPFTSIAAEITSFLKEQNPHNNAANRVIDETKKLGKIIVKQSLPLIVNIMAKQLLGEKSKEQLAEAIKDALVDYGTRFVEENEERKKGMIELKNSLKKYIEQTEYKKLIILIDELDRCKPDYSLEMLELLKHLFEIKGMIFVVASATNRLTTLIKNRMGVDNPELYIKKFFNVTIDLPEASLANFIRYYLDQSAMNQIVHKDVIEIVKQEIIELCIANAINPRSIVHCMDSFEIQILLRNKFVHPAYYPFLFFMIVKNECDSKYIALLRTVINPANKTLITTEDRLLGFELFTLPYALVFGKTFELFLNLTKEGKCQRNTSDFFEAHGLRDTFEYSKARQIVIDLINTFQQRL